MASLEVAVVCAVTETLRSNTSSNSESEDTARYLRICTLISVTLSHVKLYTVDREIYDELNVCH